MVLGAAGGVVAIALVCAAMFLFESVAAGLIGSARWACLAGAAACVLLAQALIVATVVPAVVGRVPWRWGATAGLTVLGSLSAAVSVGLLAASGRAE
jgi:hypothetical protein